MAKGSSIKVVISGDAKGALRAINETDSGLGKLGGAFAKFGKLAAVGVAAGAVAIAGVGAALFNVGQDFDAASDQIRVGTGATGAALDDLNESAKDVLKNTPAELGDVSTAIADLNTRLGLTGEPLEALSTQFLDLSRITGDDVSTSIDKVTRVFGDWEIATEDQSAALDAMFRASQASGIGMTELEQSVVSFGAPLRNLGFGFEESLALLGQFNKTGVNTETVFAGLKAGVGKLAKAGEDVPDTFRRVVGEITKMGPGTEATALAIELFGQRAGPDLADAIAGGKFELEGMLDAITNGTDTISAAAKDTESFTEKWKRLKNGLSVAIEPAASKLFDLMGDQLEKVTPMIVSFVESIDLDKAIEMFSGLLDSFAPAGDMLGQILPVAMDLASAFGGQFMLSIQALFAALQPLLPVFADLAATLAAQLGPIIESLVPVVITIGTALGTVLAGAIELLVPLLTGLIEILGPVLTQVLAALEPVFPVLAEALGEVFVALEPLIPAVLELVEALVPIIPVLAEIVAELVTALAPLLPQIAELISTLLIPALEVLTFSIQGWADLIALVAPLIIGLVEMVAEGWETYFGLILTAIDLFKEAWAVFPEFLSAIWDDITGTVGDAVNKITGFWDGIVGFVEGLPGKIASAARGMWDSIFEGFRSMLNMIIRGWNRLEFRIPGFDPPGPGPKFGGFTLGVPDIPQLANGGVVSARPGGILANIGEGRYDEAVVPLSPQVLGALGGGGRTVDVTVTVAGNVYASDLESIVQRAVETALDDELGATSDALAAL